MKKKLLSLFALLLSLLMIVLPLASCDNKDDDDDDDDGEEVTVPASDVAENLLLATLEKEDIKVNISMTSSSTQEGMESTQDLKGTIYVAKTEGVYDIKAELTIDQSYTDSTGEKHTEQMKVTNIIKDGKIYSMYDSDGQKANTIEDLGMEINVDELIEQFITMYNQEAKELVGIEINNKEDIADILGRIVSTITTGLDLGFEETSDGYKLEYKFDEKERLNTLVRLVANGKDEKLVDIVLEVAKTAGVNLTKDQLITLVDETFVAGLDLTQAIAKIENLLTTLNGGKAVSIKTYVDEAQKNSGLTTEQIVGYLKAGTGEEEMFTAPNAGETIYDYLVRKFGGVLSIDSLIAEELGEGATLATIGTEVKNILNSDMTLGAFLTEMSDSSEEVDQIFAMIASIAIDKYDMAALVEVNKDYSIKKLSFDENIKLVVGGETMMAAIGNVLVTVEYTDVDSSVFDLPADFENYYSPLNDLRNNLYDKGYQVSTFSEGNTLYDEMKTALAEKIELTGDFVVLQATREISEYVSIYSFEKIEDAKAYETFLKTDESVQEGLTFERMGLAVVVASSQEVLDSIK